jgi:hypothetical protein
VIQSLKIIIVFILVGSRLHASNSCENLLVRVDPRNGEFLIKRESLEFRSWRAKQHEWTPDTAFVYEFLDEAQIENAWALQSRFRTAQSLSNLEAAGSLRPVSDLGAIKLPQIIMEKGTFYPSEQAALSVIESRGKVRGLWKYILFEKEEKFYCYIWLSPNPDTLTHSYVASQIVKNIPGVKIIWGDRIILNAKYDSSGTISELEFNGGYSRMEIADDLRPHFATNEQIEEISKKHGPLSMIILGFVKESLRGRLSPDVVFTLK